jgi:hypothetical protein
MLKKGLDKNNFIKIYDLYLQRVIKEGDFIWSRFKIYFSFNSGALLVIGFFIKPYFNISQKILDIPDYLFYLIVFLNSIGFLFSLAWFLINLDGMKWQKLMNNIITGVENFIFKEDNYALYININKNLKKTKWVFDVVTINLYIAGLFSIIWLSLILWLLIFFK